MKTARPRWAALLAACALVTVVITPSPTAAAWRDDEVTRVTVTAGVLNPPVPDGACSFASKSFTARWLPASSPSVLAASYRYRIFWQPLIGSGSYVVDWTSTTASQFVYTLPASIVAAGTYTFDVQSINGTWTSTSRSGSAEVTAFLGMVNITSCTWA